MGVPAIVTVDDFGMSEEVNRLVREAIKRRAVTAVSVMVTMPGSMNALKKLKTMRATAIGLHLNLTEGKPLTSARSLVDRSGNFLGWPRLAVRSLFGRVNSDDVQSEVLAQIALLTRQKRIDFLNSHHHIHLLPKIAAIVFPLAKQRGIERIRIPRKVWWRQYSLKALAIQWLGAWQKKYHSQSMTDYFVDIDWTGEVPHNLPGDTELSCHPTSAELLIHA